MTTYQDYVADGRMTPQEAEMNERLRTQSRDSMSTVLKSYAEQGLPADTAAFGALDTIAVHMVQWFGPDKAASVFHHYAKVCRRQKDKKKAGN